MTKVVVYVCYSWLVIQFFEDLEGFEGFCFGGSELSLLRVKVGRVLQTDGHTSSVPDLILDRDRFQEGAFGLIETLAALMDDSHSIQDISPPLVVIELRACDQGLTQ